MLFTSLLYGWSQMDGSNNGGEKYMGPKPLNNGGIFLEETRRKFTQLSIEV